MNKHFRFALLQFIFSFLCLEMQQVNNPGGSVYIDSPIFFIFAIAAAIIGIVAAFVGLCKRDK